MFGKIVYFPMNISQPKLELLLCRNCMTLEYYHAGTARSNEGYYLAENILNFRSLCDI